MRSSFLGSTFFAFAFVVGCSGGDSTSLEPDDTGTVEDSEPETSGPVCGDGKKEGSELCDDGNLVGGDGCESDCTYTCKEGTPDGNMKCDDGNPCNGTETCGTGNKCVNGTPLAESASCGMGKLCKGGLCTDITCGDAVVTAPEECDDGNVANGDGCDSCKFTCLSTDMTRNCKSPNVCVTSGTCDDAKHTCSAGTNVADGTACGSGMVCKAGACVGVSCGNGTVDPGEECEPPGSATCDASCKTIAAVVCGNGKREAGEQCDDGNVVNLDGCDSKCKFEQDHRANAVTMQFTTDAFCTANKLGGAIASSGQSRIQTALSDGVKNGTTNILFKFLGLDDLTGTADPMINIGGLGGKPAMAPTGVTYDGTKDLDWWYTVDATSIDASRNPPAAAQIAGSIAAKALTAGPGRLTIVLAFSSGATSPLTMSGVNIKATIGTASKPTASTMNPPGHLAAENLDPALMSFATMSNGQLCGAVSSFSLSKVPVPSALLAGAGACREGYTASNSLLDVIINGCGALGGIITVINKTPAPDKDDTSVGAGFAPPYTLTVASGTKIVNTCKAGATTYTAPSADFETCLKHASYSSYFKFTTDRVIIK